MLARRDRTAVGMARQRWSAAPVKPEVNPCPGATSAAPAAASCFATRTTPRPSTGSWRCWPIKPGLRVGKPCPAFDPPRRASRFFRHDDRLHSVRPDAFGVLKREGKERPFFLEWERRAVRPVTMAARIAPYLRYYAARRPLDDHGVVPLPSWWCSTTKSPPATSCGWRTTRCGGSASGCPCGCPTAPPWSGSGR